MGGAAAAPKVSARLGWESHWREMQVLPPPLGGLLPQRAPFAQAGVQGFALNVLGMPGRQQPSLKTEPAQDLA